VPSLSIVLASNNAGKLAEFTDLFASWDVQLRTQGEFIAEGAEETGTTFEANALLKARHASQASNLPAIADDSGLEVDALQGAPGVYSARYAGDDATDADNNRKLLAALEGVPPRLRTARFRCALAYVQHAHAEPVFARGTWFGRVLLGPRGDRGFGYDSLFLPDESRLTAAEMETVAKNRVSHRALALHDLLGRLVANGVIAPKPR